MQFAPKRKKQAPAIIIISLIDILIVLLIFLMVTTSFKRQPAVKIVLPQSRQAKQGTAEANLIVTVARQEPYFSLDARPVTLAKLQDELTQRVKRDPKTSVAIRGDANAPWDQVLKAMDAAKQAGVQQVNAIANPVGQK